MMDACPCCHGDPRTVCDACGNHSCWAGLFLCEDAYHAGVSVMVALPPIAPGRLPAPELGPEWRDGCAG